MKVYKALHICVCVKSLSVGIYRGVVPHYLSMMHEENDGNAVRHPIIMFLANAQRAWPAHRVVVYDRSGVEPYCTVSNCLVCHLCICHPIRCHLYHNKIIIIIIKAHRPYKYMPSKHCADRGSHTVLLLYTSSCSCNPYHSSIPLLVRYVP